VDNGEIIPSQKPRLRFEDRLLYPFEVAPETLNLVGSGERWVKQMDPETTAVVLGVLRGHDSQDSYHLVRLRSGRFEKFQRKLSTELHDKWKMIGDALDWRALREQMKQ
jgi:hypothetical protein